MNLVTLIWNCVTLLKSEDINASVTDFAVDIAFPLGLKFGPDGYLYVALAGIGGTATTTCTQVNGLGFASGVADVEFIGNQFYALLDAGCSHGNADYPGSVIKVNTNGTWSVVAYLSTYFANNPVAAPEEENFEPDGDPYSMDLYVIEPNHGEMIKVTTNGNVSRVIDFSAHFGHIIPTSVAYHGNFFVGNLRTFPLVRGSSSIYKVTPNGEVQVWATWVTGILGVAFDKKNKMYLLETSAGGGPTPMTGRVVRVNSNDSRNVVVDHLFFPTGMTFGPDSALYILNTGFGPPTGKILKVVF